jgi:hypothetical protein
VNGEVLINFSVEAFVLGSTDYGLASSPLGTLKPIADFSIKFIDSTVTD